MTDDDARRAAERERWLAYQAELAITQKALEVKLAAQDRAKRQRQERVGGIVVTTLGLCCIALALYSC